jgi:hypothetical protein
MWNEEKAGRLRERSLYEEVEENCGRWKLSAKKSLRETPSKKNQVICGRKFPLL